MLEKVLFILLLLPFLYINNKIIYIDLIKQRIPNKLLLSLIYILPFWYMYIYIYQPFPGLNLTVFIIQILLSIIIWFCFYSFRVWWAGDSKYLLVLALFIPYIGIISFIGNIALLTCLYLFLYFLWFYTIKYIWNIEYSKELIAHIINDTKEKLSFTKKKQRESIWTLILKSLFSFLVFFTFIRILRDYILTYLISHDVWVSFIWWMQQEYMIPIYIVIIIGIILILRSLFQIWKKYISARYWYEEKNISLITSWVWATVLLMFIIYEYLHDPSTISSLLIKVATFYIFLYIIIKLLIYSYKICFWYAEERYVHMKDLKVWQTIDKTWLIKRIAKYHDRRYIESKWVKLKKILYTKMDKKKCKQEIKDISMSLTQDDIKIIQHYCNLTKKIRETYEENQEDLNETDRIKILKTFALGVYIYMWFIFSVLFWNSFIVFLLGIFRNILLK